MLEGFFQGQPCLALAAPFDITISRHEGDLNVVQPDLMGICDLEEKLGGDGYYHGVPDLVVEILSNIAFSIPQKATSFLFPELVIDLSRIFL